ncbi:MAG: hypothetical protein ACD_62C00454G0002 [uncultured bacterium]|nr:MAG: hypothetical protein ACD_62C00454G0002 [uncultured bacterium]
MANPDRFHAKRVWIVDPLDGTKEFIQKNPQFAVSIALVEEQSPLLGVIYNPISRELFWAIKGGGSFFQKQPLSVTKTVLSDKPHLLVSVSEHKRGDWTKFESLFSLIPRGGSAYKMVGIAQGLAEGSFTLCPKNEWDICAGHLIIEEAGGFVCNLDGSPITYNKPITGMDGVIYGCSEEMKKRILSVIVPPYPQPLIKCTSIPRK